jgi:hypothetical protein
VADAGSTVDELMTGVSNVATLTNEIMSSSQEQSQGIEQVNQAINQRYNTTPFSNHYLLGPGLKPSLIVFLSSLYATIELRRIALSKGKAINLVFIFQVPMLLILFYISWDLNELSIIIYIINIANCILLSILSSRKILYATHSTICLAASKRRKKRCLADFQLYRCDVSRARNRELLLWLLALPVL